MTEVLVLHAQHVADMMKYLILFSFISIFLTSSAYGHSVESVVGQYDGEERTTQILGAQGTYILKPRKTFFENRPFSLGLGFNQKSIFFKEANSTVVNDQLEGEQNISQQDFSLSMSQNINLMTDVSIFYSGINSPLVDSKTFGASVARWTRKETLKLTLTLSQTSSNQISAEIYDTDQTRVRLPTDLEGQNATVSFVHYTTPVLITTGSASFTQRSDRPNAHAETIGIRRYFKKTRSALHLGGGYFTNIGELNGDALFGSVSAYSVKGEWHQRFMRKFIAMAGYRYYSESVQARNEFENTTALASDSIYAKLRYRFGAKRWLEPSHEARLFAEQYSTNDDRSAILMGLGLSAQFK